MIKVVIVEDDHLHGEKLATLILEVDKTIKICKVETNITGALQSIGKYKPDLVFVDIILENGETGFELVRQIEEIDFNIIFISAHLNYENTLNALRLCALDFLPKPFMKSEIEGAINKHKNNQNIEVQKLQMLKNNIVHIDRGLKEIWIANGSEYIKVEVANILYAKSDNESTTFYLLEKIENKQLFVSSRSIGEWEKLLQQTSIFRSHNQYLINLKHVIKYTKGEGGHITLKNNVELAVSRNKKDELLKKLKI